MYKVEKRTADLEEVWLVEKELSLYLHFPFCKTKCHYCDFNSQSGRDDLIPDYVEALLLEIKQSLPQRRHLSSVYFGGGTPSYLPPELLVRLLRYIKANFLVSPRTEITVEINPGTISIEGLIQLKEAGFNRLSIGLQATQEHLLKKIGRVHSWREFCDLVELAREVGFTNLGVDLIFGLPGQTLADWQDTLKRVVELGPKHISAYALQLEPSTLLGRQVKEAKTDLPDEETVLKMMRLAMEYLPEHGYGHYEISNYAQPGYESVHNLGYWQGRDYLGYGSGSHSKIYRERRENVKDTQEYIQLLQAGKAAVASRETVDPRMAMTEALLLGLRLRSGINLKRFAARHGVDLLQKAGSEIDKLTTEGLVTVNEGRLALSQTGVPLSNYLISSLLAKL